MLAAGRLRHRVTIQQDQGTSRDDNGEHIEDYQDLATVWAEVKPLSGRELWAARQTQSEVTHRVTVRYSSALADLTGSIRVIHRDRAFHMDSVLNTDERRRELVMMCIESPDFSLLPSSLFWGDIELVWGV